jgi:hypothetical protein
MLSDLLLALPDVQGKLSTYKTASGCSALKRSGEKAGGRSPQRSTRARNLRVDLGQRHRLAEIITNLGDRITEARANGWLGEVQGLQVSLDAARAKMANLVKLTGPARAARPTSVSPPAGRPSEAAPSPGSSGRPGPVFRDHPLEAPQHASCRKTERVGQDHVRPGTAAGGLVAAGQAGHGAGPRRRARSRACCGLTGRRLGRSRELRGTRPAGHPASSGGRRCPSTGSRCRQSHAPGR